MGWGSSFDDAVGQPLKAAKLIGWDLTKSDDETVAITGIIENGILKIDAEYRGEEAKILIENYTKARTRNLKPTHDPYTNPDAHIYYECACGAILDPQTKSFAALNNCASEKGWKIRFTDKGYVPYCVKCGEGME